MAVNPAESKFFEYLSEQALKNPPKPMEEITLADVRTRGSIFLEYTGKPADVSFKNMHIPARDGYDIPVRIYNDHLPTGPVLICYPGCAYIQDLFEINAIAYSRIAKYSGLKVIVVSFRIAPENPLPTSIYDGYDATKYIAQHASQFNIDPKRIFIGGLSSGAHCAAVISSLTRDENAFKIHHQILINGLFDMTQSNHEYDKEEQEDKLLTRSLVPMLFKFQGVAEKDYKNPLCSPYYETNFAGFPPTTIVVSEHDGIRNDSEGYYKKLKNAGVPIEKIVVPGQTHNTIIMREVLSDGVDPAEIIADVMKKQLT